MRLHKYLELFALSDCAAIGLISENTANGRDMSVEYENTNNVFTRQIQIDFEQTRVP